MRVLIVKHVWLDFSSYTNKLENYCLTGAGILKKRPDNGSFIQEHAITLCPAGTDLHIPYQVICIPDTDL